LDGQWKASEGMTYSSMNLKEHIRTIPNYPKPGILFRDITPLLSSPSALRYAIDELANKINQEMEVDTIGSIEARGFLFAAPIAYKLNKPLVPIRKPGKLPFSTRYVTYDLEYGRDKIEIHEDAITEGEKVVLVDDLLATGGTMDAAATLVENCGGVISGLATLIELTELEGRSNLSNYHTVSLIEY